MLEAAPGDLPSLITQSLVSCSTHDHLQPEKRRCLIAVVSPRLARVDVLACDHCHCNCHTVTATVSGHPHPQNTAEGAALPHFQIFLGNSLAKGRFSYQELIDVHAGIDCNLPAEVVLQLLILDALWRSVSKQLRQTLRVKAFVFIWALTTVLICLLKLDESR